MHTPQVADRMHPAQGRPDVRWVWDGRGLVAPGVHDRTVACRHGRHLRLIDTDETTATFLHVTVPPMGASLA